MVVKTEVLTVPQIVEAMVAKDGQAFASSRAIAEHFGKRHDSVLRSIVNLTNEDGCTRHNFVVSEYRDSSGRQCTEYLMDKDACVLLIMGFTGKAALQFKYAYIAAFNAMAERLVAQPLQDFRIIDQLRALHMERIIEGYHGRSPRLRHRMFAIALSPEEAAARLSAKNPSATPLAVMQMMELQKWIIRDPHDGRLSIDNEALQEGFLTYRHPPGESVKIRILRDGMDALKILFSGV